MFSPLQMPSFFLQSPEYLSTKFICCLSPTQTICVTKQYYYIHIFRRKAYKRSSVHWCVALTELWLCDSKHFTYYEIKMVKICLIMTNIWVAGNGLLDVCECDKQTDCSILLIYMYIFNTWRSRGFLLGTCSYKISKRKRNYFSLHGG